MSVSFSLEYRLKRHLAEHGAMSLADYMAWCLYDEHAGYYRTHEPLGAQGDFITSPEISQIFGEMIAIWLITQWQALGSPKPCYLLELGAGNGTLMQDMLRTIQHLAPVMLDSIVVQIIEISEALRIKQQQRLQMFPVVIQWKTSLMDLEPYPLLWVANEFFDALPIHQYSYQHTRWQEKCVALAHDKLVFQWSNVHAPENYMPFFVDGEGVYETSPASHQIMQQLAKHLVLYHGVGIAIDYGYSEGHGDTFQALRHHAYANPLEHLGATDLTAHVDFRALCHMATITGISNSLIIPQGAWLQQLGIHLRALMVCKHATVEQKDKMMRDVHRLTSREGMGELFKCLIING